MMMMMMMMMMMTMMMMMMMIMMMMMMMVMMMMMMMMMMMKIKISPFDDLNSKRETSHKWALSCSRTHTQTLQDSSLFITDTALKRTLINHMPCHKQTPHF